MTRILNGDNFVVIGKVEPTVTLSSNDNCSNGVSGNHFNGKHTRLSTAGRSNMPQFHGQRNDDYNTNIRISSGKYEIRTSKYHLIVKKRHFIFNLKICA